VPSGSGTDPDDPSEFAAGTDRRRAFQADRGLRVDGMVGRHTWESIVDGGFTLGTGSSTSGSRCCARRHRCAATAAERPRVRRASVDGRFGADTLRALMEFQRSTGLVVDGICGPSTIDALDRVGGFADGSVATARERASMRQGPHRLEGRRVFVATTPASPSSATTWPEA